MKIKKAMVLAAGLGTRLRPLTYKIPKPLLPLNSHCVIDLALKYLASFGIEEVVINLYHLGDMIRGHVGNGRQYGLKNVTYSEEPILLGTGGGIKIVADLFGRGPFACLNADSLINANLHAVLKRHIEAKAVATMVLKERRDEPYEGVAVDKNNLVTNIGGTGPFFYTGLQIITKPLLDLLPQASLPSCLIKDGYRKLLRNGGPVAAYIYDGPFCDIGTPERYEKARSLYRPVRS